MLQIKTAIMTRPRLYGTEEERRTTLRASWHTYNKTHIAERAAHNKAYCQRDGVKQRRRKLRVACAKGVPVVSAPEGLEEEQVSAPEGLQ